ncbi:MAG: reverse transcriptase family protein [Paramuribaculum sp.]|nr:reverse transcriptase family protein [Paramuribaculum sp.]
MRDKITEYLKDITISSRTELFDTLNFIAPILGEWSLAEPLSGRKLMHFAYVRTRAKGYVDFEIPKKSGGVRKISAPVKPLKGIQSAINILLQSIFEPSPNATGFVIGKSVKDNAIMHVGQTCIYNIDLQNFFPCITKTMVRRALIRELGDKIQSREAINIICRLCTVPDAAGIEVLPQGAPTSPVLSNIVLKVLDEEMARLAERMGARYSRYADDMTFSHHKPIRRITPYWQTKIEKVVSDHGLRINDKKTKTYVPGVRREVTGIVISDKVNVSRTYVKQLRVLLHLWDKYGYAKAQNIFTNDFDMSANKRLANVIDGKINYLEMIKGKEDSTYRTLKRKFTHLQWKEKQNSTPNT